MRLFKGITGRAAAPELAGVDPFDLRYSGLRRRHRIWVHGHRGSASTHPENTLASFQEGQKAGADLIELDVHLSADGIPVVFHDEMLSARLCRDSLGKRLRRRVALRRLRFEQLCEYDVGTIGPRRFKDWRPVPGSRIPSLDALCAWSARQTPALGLNIEIKMGGEPVVLRPDPDEFAIKVLEVIRRHGLEGRVQLQSFYPDMVAALRREAPREKVSLLVDRGVRWIAQAVRLGVDMVGPRFRLLDAKAIANCHGEGLAVVPWTVNHEVHWERLVRWGVDGIITDYPRKLVQFLSRYNG
jgi:glycerophosphoryl diester phosphodiesterase